MIVAISACLVGCKCRYDGGDNLVPWVAALQDSDTVILCPEVLGGLSTPRKPCEIVTGRIQTQDGEDYTHEFELGANLALQMCLDKKVTRAYLKAKSPSCGSGQIYDGSFTRTLTQGDGLLAEKLKQHGIEVICV